jgi:hypothetical protein
MNQVIYAGNYQFFCTVRPVPIKNALGFVRTVLREYELTSTNGENYKLYKTMTGDWFDVAEANPTAETAFLNALKIAVAGQEMNTQLF